MNIVFEKKIKNIKIIVDRILISPYKNCYVYKLIINFGRSQELSTYFFDRKQVLGITKRIFEELIKLKNSEEK